MVDIREGIWLRKIQEISETIFQNPLFRITIAVDELWVVGGASGMPKHVPQVPKDSSASVQAAHTPERLELTLKK